MIYNLFFHPSFFNATELDALKMNIEEMPQVWTRTELETHAGALSKFPMAITMQSLIWLQLKLKH